MGAIILSIFGKNSNLNVDDLNNKLLKKYREGNNLEFKSMKELSDHQLIRSLVGFLNNPDGNGLLILGVSDKVGLANELSPISSSAILSEDQLNAKIISLLKSTPKIVYSPKVDIIKIPITGESNIFMIEIDRKEDAIYYSGVDNQVWIRRGSNTEKLSLVETLTFMGNKLCARVYLNFDSKPKNKDDSLHFTLGYLNEGLEPGREVTSLIKVFSTSKINYELKGSNITDTSEINQDANKAYQITSGFDEIILYPKCPIVVGKLILENNKDFEIIFSIENYEGKGLSKQIIKITKDKGILSVNEVERTYQSYLSL